LCCITCNFEKQAAQKRSELSRAATFGGCRSGDKGHDAWMHHLKENMQV
jgi:hypothetical protein